MVVLLLFEKITLIWKINITSREMELKLIKDILENMGTIEIVCMTLLVVLVVYWIMPIKKMKAVNGELKSLLQILPISQIIKSLSSKKENKKEEP